MANNEDVSIKITDIDTLTNEKKYIVKIAGVEIDIERIPIKVMLTIRSLDYTKTNEADILEKVIIPLVEYQNKKIVIDEAFRDKFTVNMVNTFLTTLIDNMYKVSKKEDEDTDTDASGIGDCLPVGQTYKKKE